MGPPASDDDLPDPLFDQLADFGSAAPPAGSRLASSVTLIAAIARAYGAATPAATAEDGDAAHWGHLRVYEQIGAGSFGSVHRAWDTVLEREVALKRRRSDGALGLAGGLAFLEEARCLARVRHPNVLAVHGAGTHDGQSGLWTDLLHGETLAAELKHYGTLPAGVIVDVLDALAAALGAVHAAGLVHGDVKPANVMRERDGRIVLMDFGAGLRLDSLQGAEPTAGTPAYLAPEVWAGDPVDAAADLYALGALATALACGSPPRPVQAGQAPDERVRGHLPKPLAALVLALLQRDPRARPAPAAVRSAIADWRAAPARRRRGFALAAVMASLVLVALSAFLAYQVSEQARRRAEAARQKAERAALTAQRVSRFYETLVKAVDPVTRTTAEPPTVQDLVQQGARSIERSLAQEPSIQADLYGTLAQMALGLGDLPLARQYVTRGAALAERGDAPAPRIEALIVGAQILHAEQHFDQAEADIDRAFVLLSRLPAPDPDLELLAHNLKGVLEVHAGRADRALPHFERVLAIAEAMEPAEIVDRTIALTNIASAARRIGKSRRAETAVREAMRLQLTEIPPTDPKFELLHATLGAVLLDQGRLAEARSEYRAALAIAEASGGKDGAEARADRLDLANLHLVAGDWRAARTAAEPLHGLAVAQSDLYEQLRAANLLGHVALLAAQPEIAAGWYERAVAAATALYGDRHRSRWQAQGFLAHARALADPAQADALRAVVQTLESEAGGSRELAFIAHRLAQVEKLAQRPQEGLAACELGLGAATAALGTEDRLTHEITVDCGLLRARVQPTFDLATLEPHLQALERMGRGWLPAVQEARRLLPHG